MIHPDLQDAFAAAAIRDVDAGKAGIAAYHSMFAESRHPGDLITDEMLLDMAKQMEW